MNRLRRLKSLLESRSGVYAKDLVTQADNILLGLKEYSEALDSYADVCSRVPYGKDNRDPDEDLEYTKAFEILDEAFDEVVSSYDAWLYLEPKGRLE